MAPVSQPLPYYRTRGPYANCPDEHIPQYPPVAASEASKRRPILGRPPVSLTPVPTDDEISKSTVFTQLLSNWDQLNQENFDAGAFDHIKDFNRIIASDEPGPKETLDEATQRKTRDLLNMVHLISLSKPIVCSYEDQNYWKGVASPHEEDKTPWSGKKQYINLEKTSNQAVPAPPDDDLLSRHEMFDNQDTEQTAFNPALLGQLNHWTDSVVDTSLQRQSGSSVSDMSLSRQSGSSVSEMSLTRQPGSCVSDMSSSRHPGFCVSKMSLSRQPGSSLSEMSFPRQSGSCVSDMSLPRQSGSCVSDMSLPRQSGSSPLEMSLPRQSRSWSLSDDDLSKDPNLLPDVSPVEEIFDDAFASIFPESGIDYRILNLHENDIFTPLKFDNFNTSQSADHFGPFSSCPILPPLGKETTKMSHPTLLQYNAAPLNGIDGGLDKLVYNLTGDLKNVHINKADDAQQNWAENTSDSSCTIEETSEEPEVSDAETLVSSDGYYSDEAKPDNGDNITEEDEDDDTDQASGGKSAVDAPSRSVEGRQPTSEADQSSETDAEPEKFCGFCQRKGKSEEQYTSHNVKDTNGRVICPALRSIICRLCGATGAYAHTQSYCPDYWAYAYGPQQFRGSNIRHRGRRY